MKLSLLPGIAALVLGTGVAANAADTNAMPGASTQSGATDNLSLTRVQERTARKDLDRHAWQQSAPSSFTPSIGATVPDEITLRAMPQRAANQLPALRPYDFAVLPKQLLIVNPNDKKIVDVIDRNA
jgi:hypothetical protein